MRATVAAVMVLLAATGCSEPRGYEVPNQACGVTVDPDLLTPFLPYGKELTQRSDDAGPESPRCRLSVDKKLVIYLSGDVVSKDTDPIEVQDRALRRLGNPTAVDIGDDARVADRGATAVAACTYEGQQRKFVSLIQLQEDLPDGTSERRNALQSFLRSYFPEAMAQQGCK
ncbi:hypothetical protein [Streptomyces sp. NPDC018693]|uniref:hypothetical protein n=1 Tax=unclassified Streptomyces TaxID=2593676 RepID=UPI0037910F39